MTITLKAPAKLNLTLDVVGKRDDGYHLLDMLIQMVDLCDDVEIALNDSGKVTLWESTGELPVDGDNLAVKAARMLLDEVKSPYGCHIRLTKRIPVSAGLGGGSSDAAAVLKGLNKLLGYPMTPQQLAEFSLPLGADVPMCVLGGALRARGIGEELETLKTVPACYFVITKNGTKPSTGEMYRRLSAGTIARRPDTERCAEAIKADDLKTLCDGVYNVFLHATDDPVVDEDMEIIKNSGALAVGLSGSGPSVFGIFEDLQSADKCVKMLDTHRKKGFICKAI